MRIPVVALVGRPDCGKTTLLEKLLPELKRRGLRVGTIKHHVHEFNMDTPGKDTWRHKQAGAEAVILSSPTGIGLIRDSDRDLGIDELTTRYLGGLDLVIAEGYKRTRLPKIEVYRAATHPEPLPRDQTWIALVGDFPPAATADDQLPRFADDQVAAIADFLIQRFLPEAAEKLGSDTNLLPANGTNKKDLADNKLVSDPNFSRRQRISLEVDGLTVPLNRFAAALLRKGIRGMIASLRGCEDPREIRIRIGSREE